MEVKLKFFVVCLLLWILFLCCCRSQSTFSTKFLHSKKFVEGHPFSLEDIDVKGNDDGRERFFRSPLLSTESIILDIQSSLIHYWNEYIERSGNIQKLTLVPQTQSNEFLKPILMLNISGNGDICQTLKTNKNTLTISDESTNDSNDVEGILHSARNTEENESSEISIEGSNAFRELRQDITSVISDIVTDAPRLGQIHQEQLNALAAIGGVPENIVNPEPTDVTKNDVINLSKKFDSYELIDVSNMQRRGHSFDISNMAYRFQHLLQDIRTTLPYLFCVLIFSSLFLLVFQLLTGFLTPGTIVLSLLAISDIYLRYSMQNGDEDKWMKNLKKFKSFDQPYEKLLDEITNTVTQALEHLALFYLDDD